MNKGITQKEEAAFIELIDVFLQQDQPKIKELVKPPGRRTPRLMIFFLKADTLKNGTTQKSLIRCIHVLSNCE